MRTEKNIEPRRGSWYNGYSPAERDKKSRELKRLIAKGVLLPASGPCALCGDPDNVPVEYHDEDYGEPFSWEAPVLLCLCRNCHRDKLHKRFWRHSAWFAFIAHIRRGGYARDLKNRSIKNEVKAYQVALERGELITLKKLRPYKRKIGEEWFANLRMDAESLCDPSARPRP
ncbi:hypothetical protein SAMN05421863_102843 [Nitrosomonas communis]|uniref:Uncharacterized protein n=2 Tax=Nitrosomonas communis TaxID=44574 RepID=A0A1I4QT83_9PROT|nr:hypothetical protein SAMN05421863_102843 [Nitrosomonas communis]